jgi:hypothetical protein
VFLHNVAQWVYKFTIKPVLADDRNSYPQIALLIALVMEGVIAFCRQRRCFTSIFGFMGFRVFKEALKILALLSVGKDPLADSANPASLVSIPPPAIELFFYTRRQYG